MILSVSAVIGFAVYYELVEISFLEPVSSNGMKVTCFMPVCLEYLFCNHTAVTRLVAKSRVSELAGCHRIYYWSCQRGTLSVGRSHHWSNKTIVFSTTNAFGAQ